MKKLFYFFTLVLFYLFASSAEAAIYWVSASLGSAGNCGNAVGASPPSNYLRTITAGLACLSSGDTLYIRTGTYNELLTIPGGTTVAGYPGELPVIKPASNGTGIINLMNNNITMRNLEISGEGFVMGDACFGGSSPTGHLIEDVKVHHCVRGPGGPDTGGIGLLLGGSGHTIRRMEAYNNDNSDPSPAGDNGGYGVYLAASNSVIEYSYFYDNAGLGVQAYTSNPTVIGHNTIRYNRFYRNGFASRKNLGALTVANESNVVYGNVIWDNKWSGIDMLGGGFSAFSGVIYNNTIVNNGATSGSFGIELINGTATIKNNILVSNAGGNIVDWVGGITATHNLCNGAGGTAGCTSSGVIGDPLFVSASAGASSNFRLQAGSPALNVGDALGSPYNVDIDGTTRPQGAGYDLGAYERGTTATCPSNPNSLVASYSFNGVATDSSGSGVGSATLGSGVTYASAHAGQGLLLPGTAGATVADNNQLDLCNGFTLAGWINIPSTSTDVMFIVKDPNSKYFLGMLNGQCAAGAALVGGYSQATTVITCDPATLATGTDIYVAVTYDGTTVRLYKNATLVNSVSGGATLDATTGVLSLCTSGFSEHCVNGTKLDEVKIYTYARSAAELFDDMGTPTGASGRVVKVGSGQTLKIGQQ